MTGSLLGRLAAAPAVWVSWRPYVEDSRPTVDRVARTLAGVPLPVEVRVALLVDVARVCGDTAAALAAAAAPARVPLAEVDALVRVPGDVPVLCRGGLWQPSGLWRMP